MHEAYNCRTYYGLCHCVSVCLSVCVTVCWAHAWDVQKRLNRSRCRFGGWYTWTQKPYIGWVATSPGRSNFGCCPAQCKALGVRCGVRSKMDHSTVNNGTTCIMRPSSKFCNHFYLEVLCKVFNIPFFRLPVYLPWRAWRRHFSLSHYRFPFFAGTYRVIKLLHSVTPFGDWVVWNTAMPVDRRIFSPLLLLRNPV